MRATDIPDAELLDGTRRITIGAPPGFEESVSPVEACAEMVGNVAHFHMRIVLEPGDLEHLQAGEPIWLTMMGGVSAFSLGFAELVPLEEADGGK